MPFVVAIQMAHICCNAIIRCLTEQIEKTKKKQTRIISRIASATN